MQLWSERGELLLQLGDLAPGVVTTTVTLSMDGRYIIRSVSMLEIIVTYYVTVAGLTHVSA